jgi:hypothetical protein
MVLFVLLCWMAGAPLSAQESMHQVHEVMDMPEKLDPAGLLGCTLDFHEQWTIRVPGSSVTKDVQSFAWSCAADSSVSLFPAEGHLRVRNITYEFSFLDPAGEVMRELQEDFIALINKLHPLPGVYQAKKELLSVYFHEEWILDAEQQSIQKSVTGITPVIWQIRQTVDGDPVLDGDTGYPVYFTHRLNRIPLRQSQGLLNH